MDVLSEGLVHLLANSKYRSVVASHVSTFGNSRSSCTFTKTYRN